MNNLDDILKLLKAISELPYDSVEVMDGNVSVRVSRGIAAPMQQQSGASLVQAASRPVVITGQTEEKAVTVSSPIIGIFYASPSPEDEPFVQAGDSVQAGQTLCIIEAMKLMNEIPSPVSGVVTKVLAQDSGDVEVGQALFLIEPQEG